MPPAKASASNSVLRHLPSVDELLRSAKVTRIADEAGDAHAAELARRIIDEMRSLLQSGATGDASKETLVEAAANRLALAWRAEQMTGIKRVINATGVVIHTNLGRAPLSDASRRAVADAAGYCTLEYDLDSGKRGRRGPRSEQMLAELTGAEDVLIVNNCAAAAFFVLTVFAGGGEVIVSRGELVEIGGDFRVPDVLTQSGATLCEVGTTNRTKLADYENAITAQTRVILRVHPSNYRIVGFTATPTLGELAGLAEKHGLLLYEDLGSGALVDMNGFGLGDEPVVASSLVEGAAVVTFSGDKLLGGPQAGIIAGKSEIIDQLRKHPLYRALRVDKLTYAALEATLGAYRRGVERAETPVIRMLSMSKDEIATRARQFIERLSEGELNVELVDGVSAIGGGAAPAVHLATTLIALTHKRMTASRIEHSLRTATPPVIARIVDDRVMIDLRTVAESEEEELLAAVMNCLRVLASQNRG